MNLATKVISFGISALVLILSFMGYYSYTMTKDNMLELFDKQISSGIQLISLAIDNEQNNIQHIAEIFTTNRTVKKALDISVSRGVNQILNESIRLTPTINYILLSDSDGFIFASSTVDRSGKKIDSERLLVENIIENPMYPMLERVDSINEGDIGIDPYMNILNIEGGLSQWFVKSIHRKGEIVGRVVISYDWSGAHQGVLKRVVDELLSNEMPVSAALIIDKDKKVVVHESNKDLVKNLKILNGTPIVFSEDLLWKSKTLSFGLDDFELMVLFDKESAFKPLSQMNRVITVIAVVGGILLSLFLYILIKKVVLNRVNQLMYSAKEIGQGNLSVELKDLGPDEIGDLGRSITTMAKNLQKTTTSRDFLDLEIQRTDEILRELNEQKYALDAHAIVGITDVAGVIVNVNDKFVEISGYSREELIGNNHRIVNSGVHDTSFWKDMYNTVKSGKTWHSEVCNRNKDGELYWVDTTIVPFLNEKGRPKSYIAIRTDLTEQKKAEAEIFKAKEIAEDSARAKSEFLASMSHEIRTPMNGVIGMLGLLLNSQLDYNQRHQAQVAQSSANSLLTLINDILDFSKIEAGKIDLEEIEFNLRDELGNFIETIAFRATEKGVEVILDLTEIEESVIKSDPLRIRQLLNNIVGNAIKFTDKGGEIIVKGVLDTSIKIPMLTISVSDTGIGIPADKIESLFESFTQVDASTTRKFGGTGLGLAITKRLCTIMGGEVIVTSKEGEGSVFTFSIPVFLGENNSLVAPVVNIEGKRALIVDDNRTNREILEAQLNRWGMITLSAKDGFEALNILENERFDVAFLDMQMPNMDGEELGRTIRLDKNSDSMKLVMMTSLGSRADAKRFGEAGFNAFFPKPTTTKDLFLALNVLIEDGEALNCASPLVTKDFLGTLGSEEKFIPPKDTKILLVEDNLVNQKVATGFLESLNLKADIAENGIEALQKLGSSTYKYDVILMDCMMPEMDGYTATQKIRAGEAGEENSSIPIVAMTANAMKGDREKCFAAGMSDYISKPISIIDLKNSLSKWLLGEEREKSIEENRERVLQDWNYESLLKRFGNNRDLVSSVVEVFLDDIEKLLKELQEGIDSEKYDTIKLLAHSIKGSSGNIAAEKLSDAAKKIEEYSKSGTIEDIDKEFEVLKVCKKVVIEKLKEFINKNRKTQVKKTSIDRENLAKMLIELKDELNAGAFIDSNDLELFKVSYNEEINELLQNLKKEIDQFALESALESIEKIEMGI